jgi:SOS-response transcriptional repressor LexA
MTELTRAQRRILDFIRAGLRAESPKYPKLFPAGELVIQGVMVALIRKRK